MKAAICFCILGVVSSAAATATAAERVCDRCGCTACCKRVCVCKPVEKEITKVCWDVKCEDVCIPGCSEKCGEKCQTDECGTWKFGIWKPGCAKIKTRHIPVKKEVKRKVPGFEWVVEYRCPNCCQEPCDAPPKGADEAAMTPPRELAELPAPAAR